MRAQQSVQETKPDQHESDPLHNAKDMARFRPTKTERAKAPVRIPTRTQMFKMTPRT